MNEESWMIISLMTLKGEQKVSCVLDSILRKRPEKISQMSQKRAQQSQTELTFAKSAIKSQCY